MADVLNGDRWQVGEEEEQGGYDEYSCEEERLCFWERGGW